MFGWKIVPEQIGLIILHDFLENLSSGFRKMPLYHGFREGVGFRGAYRYFVYALLADPHININCFVII